MDFLLQTEQLLAVCDNNQYESIPPNTCLDPKYEDEVSGCTATVALISDAKIWVVSLSTKL